MIRSPAGSLIAHALHAAKTQFSNPGLIAALGTASSVMTIGFSITGCSNSKNRFDERTQDWLVKKFGLRRPRRLDANRAQPHFLLVCYTAVFIVVTQRSSPQTARSFTWRHQTRLRSRLPFFPLNQEENKRRLCGRVTMFSCKRETMRKLYLKNIAKCFSSWLPI